MRLIDADYLSTELRKSTELLNGNTLVPVNLLLTLIEKTPTVYDVDNVVEQINETREIFESRNIVPLINMDKAIQIVKDGGLSKQ